MAVVIDLDPLGRRFQTKDLGHAGEELGLGRTLRHASAQGFAGVGGGVLDQFCLLAALGAVDLDLAAGFFRQGLGQQGLVRQVMADQDQLGARLVVIELAHEGVQYLAVLVMTVDAREIGAVAPVLAGAEEEDLHAGLTALREQGEDIGLLQGFGIDHLFGGDGGQSPDAVAKAGGGFEL